MDIKSPLQHLKLEAKITNLINQDIPLTELVKYSQKLDKYIMIKMKILNK